MSRINSEVDSLLESDEVSQIDGLHYTSRSRSYSDVYDYGKPKPPITRTISVRGLEPDIAQRRRKYEEREKQKSRERALKREIEKSVEESIAEELESQSSETSKGKAERSKSKRKPKPKKSITKKLKEKLVRKKEPVEKKKEPSPKVEKKKEKKDPIPEEKKKNENLPPHTKEEEIKLTKGFIPVPRSKWESLEAGREIMWMNVTSERVSSRTAYYWYQKENKDGKRFFMCGPTAQCDMKTPWINKSKFPLFWDKLKRIYVREDPFTQGLRLAIDNRTYQISDIAHFLKLKFGDEFEQFIKNRELERQAKSSKK